MIEGQCGAGVLPALLHLQLQGPLMPSLHNLRGIIETFLNSLDDEAWVGEGISLRVDPQTAISLQHRREPKPTATLNLHPPPVIVIQRGPFRVRCSLSAVVIEANAVRLVIDGWFDQHWHVSS